MMTGMWEHTWRELFFRGGEVMWPILVCSILGLAIAAERVLVFCWYFTPYHGLVRALKRQIEHGDLARARQIAALRHGPIARAAESYLEHIHLTSAAREDIVGRVVSENVSKLETRLHWLSIIGILAPMLGLLGTVAGLVEAFNEIERAGGQVQPKDLASGIWAALLTTVFGLVVALPALAVYHLLENRVNTILLQCQWMVSHLNEWLHKQPSLALEGGEHIDTMPDERLTSVGGG
ncbi:MAG: MotA/TolQ/ExbB proton channel family protein [Planctomycetia bacterium]|nr:MotA/TolQ/ExbB proton channel family protein [Planctomycetia bacterium]